MAIGENHNRWLGIPSVALALDFKQSARASKTFQLPWNELLACKKTEKNIAGISCLSFALNAILNLSIAISKITQGFITQTDNGL